MDKLQPYEVQDMLDGIKYQDRGAWERARFAAYINTSMFSKNKIEPADLLKFPWEEAGGAEERHVATDKDIERLRAQAKQLEKIL